MSALAMPPPRPNRSRHSPRSVVTHKNEEPTEDLPKKKLNFDGADDSSFLAGFSASLKFKDDDSFHTGFANPFREETTTETAPTQADEVLDASGTPTYKFDDDCFESNDPFKEPDAPSECRISEATTEVGSNLLAAKLLSNISSSKSHETVSSPEPASPIKKQVPTICDEARDDNDKTTQKQNLMTPKEFMFLTPDNSPKKVNLNAPVRNWSRGKVKEELKRRSTSHEKEKDMKKAEATNKKEADEEESNRNSSSNDERREDHNWEDEIRRLPRTNRKNTDIFLFNTPNREDVSTLCDETSFENNSLTHRNSIDSYSEDDSLSFLTPTPSTHRSRYSRRGRGRFLCGCDGTDRVAATVRDVKDVLYEINRSMMRNVRRYVAREPPRSSGRRHSYYDDRRPSKRRESRYESRRSRSISVRRDTGASQRRNQRGRSYDPPVTRIDF